MADEPKTAEQELEELKAAAEAAASKKEDEPKVFKIELADGSKYEAPTQEELLKKVAQAKTDSSSALRNREDQVKELQRTTREAEETRRTTTSKEGSFDQTKFEDLLVKDGSEAIQYAFEHRVGLDEGSLPESFSRQQTATEEFIQNTHMSAFFARCKDYPGGDENAKMIVGMLDSQDRKYTADNMESAFRELAREGKIKPLEISAQTTETQTRPAPPPPLAGPGTSRPIDDINAATDKMTTEQLKEFLMSPEAQKRLKEEQG